MDRPQLTGLHGHVPGGFDLRAVGDGGPGFGVQHRDGHAAGHADLPRARACDGLGVDDMALGLLFFGLQLKVKVLRQCADGLVGQRDRRRPGRASDAVDDVVLEVLIGDGGQHRLVIEHFLLEGVPHISCLLAK